MSDLSPTPNEKIARKQKLIAGAILAALALFAVSAVVVSEPKTAIKQILFEWLPRFLRLSRLIGTLSGQPKGGGGIVNPNNDVNDCGAVLCLQGAALRFDDKR